MATDYLSGQLPNLLSSGFGSDYDDINRYLGTLTPAVRQQAIQWLKQNLPRTPGPFSMGQLSGMLGRLKSQFDPIQQSATQPAPPTGTTVTSTGGQTVTVPKLGDPYTPNFAQYSPVSAQQYSGATDAASLAALAGMDAATFQKQWDDYQRQRQIAASHTLAGDEPIHGLTMQQFAAVNAASLQGQWQPLLDAFDYQWNEQYGTRMPGALRQQLLAALNGMDKNQQQLVLSAEMQYVNGLQTARGQSTGIGGAIGALNNTLLQQVPSSVGTITTQFAQAHPSISTEVAKDVQARKQGYIQWLQSHNIPITDDLLGKLAAMPAADSPSSPGPGTDYAYLMGLPSNIKGMTWGAKDIAFGNISSSWKQYFGREPTSQEITWAAGKTPAEVQDFIDNSPSHVKGLTIGRYNDYVSFINNLGTSGATTHAFSAGIDDSLISDLHHNLTSQPQQPSQPGPMA